MYIQKVTIENIRSIDHFEMEFPKPAGWHVLIGDNGSGKSTIVRAIAAVLIGPDEIAAVLPIWDEWLSFNFKKGKISLELERHSNYDRTSQTRPPKKNPIVNEFNFERNGKVRFSSNIDSSKMNPRNFNWGTNGGWFSVAYGPFRRFTGGDNKWNKVFYSAPKAGAHLSVFGEDIALSEALDWLKELDRKRLKEKEHSISNQVNEAEIIYTTTSTQSLFENLKRFINTTGLLPHNTQFKEVDIDGELVFCDGKNHSVKVIQLSDGFRSILSLTFELIRQLINIYSESEVFKTFETTQTIDVPGVVLIDEVDAHLHPSWQTRIGEWFTQYFPNIQFIVTTHSPLVCRACEKGSIWRLSAPGSDIVSGEIIGKDKQKLINGNILDAFGTEIFGSNVVRSTKSNEMLDELGKLGIKAAFGKTSPEEDRRRVELQQILSTDDPTGF
jgi:predicted ATP-binding protein involved in virulence